MLEEQTILSLMNYYQIRIFKSSSLTFTDCLSYICLTSLDHFKSKRPVSPLYSSVQNRVVIRGLLKIYIRNDLREF